MPSNHRLSPIVQKAIDVLGTLSGPDGIAASRADTANYAAVFSRDGVMAGVAGLLLGDETIQDGLLRTLATLRRFQGAEGQIPSNVRVQDGSAHVSYGTLTPKLDAATWFLVGQGLAVRAGLEAPQDGADAVSATVRLLDAVEYNGRHLLYVPAGGNWADEYPYEGYILYDQILRAWGLQLCAEAYDRPSWADKAAQIAATIRLNYWPQDGVDERDVYHPPTYRAHIDPARWHPLSAFTPTSALDAFDLAACSLLGVSGIAPDLATNTLEGIEQHFLDVDRLPPAFWPVIKDGDPLDAALKRYHLFGFRNRPHEYHNGGVWPVWLGWLAAAFALSGRPGPVAFLQNRLSARTAGTDYQFEEYLHGETEIPGGTPWMAYTATGIVLADLAASPERLALLRL